MKIQQVLQQMPQHWEDLLRQNALAWELSTLQEWSTNATGMGIGTLRIDQATKMEASSYLHRSMSGLFFVLAKIRHFLFYYNGNNGNGCTCTRPVLSSSWSRKLTKNGNTLDRNMYTMYLLMWLKKSWRGIKGIKYLCMALYSEMEWLCSCL